MPCLSPSSCSFAALRPTMIGSTWIRDPSGSSTPPWSRIARIDRTRCWRYPIRPVMPFITMPSTSLIKFLLENAFHYGMFLRRAAQAIDDRPSSGGSSHRVRSSPARRTPAGTAHRNHSPEPTERGVVVNQAVTLADVAKHAGVSLATASRVLNGSTRVVGFTLRHRVLASAAELSYEANAAAQAVVRG